MYNAFPVKELTKLGQVFIIVSILQNNFCYVYNSESMEELRCLQVKIIHSCQVFKTIYIHYAQFNITFLN